MRLDLVLGRGIDLLVIGGSGLILVWWVFIAITERRRKRGNRE